MDHGLTYGDAWSPSQLFPGEYRPAATGRGNGSYIRHVPEAERTNCAYSSDSAGATPR